MIRQKQQGAFGLPMTGLIAWVVLMAAPAHGHGPGEVEEIPDGMVQAQITEAPDIKGLQVMLLEGEHQGILVSYNGDEALTFFGESGEPLLRFTKQAVKANRHSETWQTLGDNEKPETSGDGVDWKKVANTGRYAWVDPRLTRNEVPEDRSESQSLGDWHIHMEHSGKTDCRWISGTHYWHPLGAGDKHALRDSGAGANSLHNH